MTNRVRQLAEDRFTIYLAVIVAVGFVIRLVYIFWLRRVGDFMIGDALIYHGEGLVIADGKGWIDPFFYATTGFERQLAMHPPAYPVWLAGWSFLGVRSVLGHQMVTIPIGLASVVCCALIGRRLGGRNLGLVAGALAAVHPSFWSWDAMVLGEPMAILAASLLVLAYLALIDRLGKRQLILAGLASGFGPLVRAELLVGVVLLGVTVLAVHGWRRAVVPMLAPALIAIACLAPWVTYNTLRFSHSSTLSNGFGITLSSTHCPELDGEILGYWSQPCAARAAQATVDQWFAENPDTPQLPVAATMEEYQRVRAAGGSILRPDQAILRFKDLDESERDALLRTATIKWITQHPRYEMRAIPARLGRVLGLYRPIQQIALDTVPDGRKRPIAVAAWLGYYAVAPFAVAGAVLLWRRRRAQAFVVMVPMLTVLITVTLTFGNTRYRALGEPTFAILGAYALTRLASWTRRLWRAG